MPGTRSARPRRSAHAAPCWTRPAPTSGGTRARYVVRCTTGWPAPARIPGPRPTRSSTCSAAIAKWASRSSSSTTRATTSSTCSSAWRPTSCPGSATRRVRPDTSTSACKSAGAPRRRPRPLSSPVSYRMNYHGGAKCASGSCSGRSGPEAIGGSLGQLLRSCVHHRLPVHPLEVGHVGAVEGLDVGAADEARAEHVALGRRAVDGEVEALVAQLSIEVERPRDALRQRAHAALVELLRRPCSAHERSQLVEAEGRERRQPLDAAEAAQVPLARAALGLQVVAEALGRHL